MSPSETAALVVLSMIAAFMIGAGAILAFPGIRLPRRRPRPVYLLRLAAWKLTGRILAGRPSPEPDRALSASETTEWAGIARRFPPGHDRRSTTATGPRRRPL